MPAPRRTIRLFVSSTFADLKVERDTLQNKVYPRLRALCEGHNLRFQAIDLRWGVSEEAGRHNRTLRICLRELKRCQQDTPKPNFLILLGDRYGWRPLPETISAELFEKLARQVGAQNQATEILLRAHYRLDENAVPATLVLQPRFTSKDAESKDWFKDVEQRLLAALVQAAQQLGAEPGLEKLCLGLSATHQEILHGALHLEKVDAREHVHAFFREIHRLDKTPLPADFADAEIGPASPIGMLKEEIQQHLGKDNVHRCPMDWENESFTENSLQKFADDVYDALKAVVEAQIKKLESLPPSELERSAHEQFAAERIAAFQGRKKVLKEIADYLEKGSDGKALAVVGAPGSGKSTLLAKAAEEAKLHFGESAFILDRYIGVTPGSGELGSLLRDLVRAIRQKYPQPVAKAQTEVEPPDEKPKLGDGEIPFELNPLINAFHEALQRQGADQPLLLFVDALDQFAAGNLARELYWLPSSLSAHVRLVVSAALPPEDALANDPRREVVRALEHRPVMGRRIELGKLSREDGEKLLHHWLISEESWLTGGQRKLQSAQQAGLLNAFAIEGNPLWLRAATAEAAQWPSWETDHSEWPTKVSDLLRQVLDHLAQPEEHGEILLNRALGYLASARHGLAEDELLDVLSRDEEVMKDFIERSPTERLKKKEERIKILPVAVWVRLRGDLDPYLTERDAQGASLLNFYHRSFLDVVESYCISKTGLRKKLHCLISGYFHDQADPTNDQQWSGVETRPFLEMPFHLARCDANRLAKILLDFKWLRAKTKKAVRELIQDYEEVLKTLPRKHPQRRALKLIQGSITLASHIIFKDQNQLASQLVGRLISFEEPELQQFLINAKIRSGSLSLFPTTQSLAKPGSDLLTVDFGQGSANTAVGFSHAGKLAAVAKDSGVIRIMEIESDHEIASIYVLADAPTAISVADYNRNLLWTTREGDLWAWQSGKGQVPICLDDPNSDSKEDLIRSINVADQTSALAINHDGLFAISGTYRGILQRWELTTGRKSWRVEIGSRAIRDIAISPSGSIAVCWHRHDIWCTFDTETGRLLRTFQGHREPVLCVSLSANGRTAISGASDCSVRVWDTHGDAIVKELEGHSASVTKLALSHNGRLIASASDDKTIRIVDLKTSNAQIISWSYNGTVHAMAFSSDSKTLLCAAGDNLRTWKVSL